MSLLTGTGALLALAAFLLLAPPSVSIGSISVSYARAVFRKTRGDQLRLRCNVTYTAKECRLESAFWCRYSPDDCVELKDINRYETQVSELKAGSAGQLLTRLIDFEFKNLTLDDTGEYKCNANCGNGETGMGHFIRLFIREADSTTEQVTNRGRWLRMDAVFVTICCLIPLLSFRQRL